MASTCPRCGRGKLFRGYLTLADACSSCGLDFKAADSGDGPAVFVMFIVMAVTVPLAFAVWVFFDPPIWAQLILWPVVVIGLSMWLLRPAKAIMIAIQFRHRAGEHRF